jgi:large subunit ribosomal protein L13
MNKTVLDTKENDTYKWYLIDADSKKLGRISSEISKILLGKNSPGYCPSTAIKHSVIVINAEKVEVTGKKTTDKFYRRHSGRPGGLTIETFEELQNRIPSRIIKICKRNASKRSIRSRSIYTLKSIRRKYTST